MGLCFACEKCWEYNCDCGHVPTYEPLEFPPGTDLGFSVSEEVFTELIKAVRSISLIDDVRNKN